MREKYSIFATLGTATQPFDRFVRIVDEVGLRLGAPLLIQTGFTPLTPRHCRAVDFLSRPDFEMRVREAEHVITHAGEGSVMAVLRCGKRPIVIARRKQFREHVNDHQMELVAEFEHMGLVASAATADEVMERIANAPRHAPNVSAFRNADLLRLVDSFLQS